MRGNWPEEREAESKYFDVKDEKGREGTHPAELIQWLTAQYQQIPEHLRISARVGLVGDGEGSHGGCLWISWIRPETDDERKDRLRDESEEAKVRERRERAEFERLKKKFGAQ